MNSQEIIEQAKKEFEEDIEREAIRIYKEKFKKQFKKQQSFWDKIFPWEIIIIRKDKFNV